METTTATIQTIVATQVDVMTIAIITGELFQVAPTQVAPTS